MIRTFAGPEIERILNTKRSDELPSEVAHG